MSICQQGHSTTTKHGGTGEEVGDVKETAARKQEKKNLTAIPPTPMVNQRHDTGKSSLTQNAKIENRNSEGGTKKKKV